MTDPIQLVVGLGNPGPKYDQTRHNAGFWFVDAQAKQYQRNFQAESRFSGDICTLQLAGEKLRLLKPMTFMNRSGLAVRQVVDYYKIQLHQVLVVYDEIDLPPGTARLKYDGGHGGHNGMRDIVSHLGKAFWRLRIGVGHPGHRDDVVNYVLGRPSRSDHNLIEESMAEIDAVFSDIIAGKTENAMNTLHRKK